jgi:hypothetical protein
MEQFLGSEVIVAGARKLGRNLWQYVHAADLGRDPEVFAGALLHT